MTFTKFSEGPTTSKGWKTAHLEPVPDISVEFQCAGGQLLCSPKVSSSLTFRAGIYSKLPFLIFFCCRSLFTCTCQMGKLRLRGSLKKIKMADIPLPARADKDALRTQALTHI